MTRARWPAVRLGDVLEPLKTTEAILAPASERFATIKLYGKGIVERSITSGKTPRPFTGYRLAAGELVYSRIDARHGAFALVPRALSGCVVSKDFPHFALRAHRLDADYLRFIVTSPTFYRRIAAMSFGATNRQRMGEDAFLALQIPLPPIDEQRRIAALLDQVDELRAKRRRTLALLEDLRESKIHQVVLRHGDAARPLAQVVPSISSGKSLVAGAAKAHPTARVLKISAVTTGQFRAAESKPLPESYVPPRSHLVHSGDLLVSRANTADLVGAAAVVRDEVSALYLPDKLWRLDVKSVSDKIYLWAILSSRPVRRRLSALATGSGGSMKNLSQKVFLEQLLPWPSVEQRAALVRIVDEIEASKSSARGHLAKLDELFASLQHRAFTGQL